MTAKFSHTILRSALFGVVLMLSACVNTLELASPHKNSRAKSLEQAVDGAMYYFGAHQELRTRSANAEPTEEAPFVVGNLVPNWDSAVSVVNEEKQYTDFAMRKDYDFYWLPDGNVEQRVKLYSRFASVEEFALDTINQYVATYIPDEEYLGSYRAVAQDYGINCAEWYEFSGTVLYTMISGHIVAAAHYTKGELTKSAFLYDREKTTEENIADFYAIMEGFTFGVAVAQQNTRSTGDNEENPIIIEEIVITQKRPHFPSLMTEEEDYMVNPSDMNTPIVIGMGGGGGGSNGTTTEEESSKDSEEEKVKKLFQNYDSLSSSEKQELNEAMEQIIEDCMGQKMIDTLIEKQVSPSYATSYPENFAIPDNIKDTSAYVYDQNMLVYRGEGVDVLLHELFHAYQYYSDKDFESALANYEIEAQVARTLFAIRLKKKGNEEYYNNITSAPLGKPIIYMTQQVSHTGELSDNVRNNYFVIYDKVATYFNDELNLTYDVSILTDSYRNLIQLSVNCGGYGKK